MPLELLLAQLAFFNLFLASAIDDVRAFEVDLVAVPDEGVLPPPPLLLAFSAAIVRVGPGSIFNSDYLRLRLGTFRRRFLLILLVFVFLSRSIVLDLSQARLRLVVSFPRKSVILLQWPALLIVLVHGG